MSSDISAPSQNANGFVSKLGQALLGAYLVAVIVGCVHFGINGPQIYAAAEAEKARIVAEENQRYCGKLGMQPGTTSFSDCARYMDEVRKLHAERVAKEWAGLL
jgi:hypothetical protein